MSTDLIVRAKRTAVGLRTWDHPNEANLMEDLADEIRDLREQLEMREGLLLRAGRDNLRLHNIVEKVRALGTRWAALKPGDDDITDSCLPADVEQTNGEVLLRTIDGAPDSRRVATAEELDALPTGTAILDGGECVAVKGGADGAWFYPMGPFEPMLPATVLWLPEVSS